MNFKEFLKDNICILDGGMGTLLQAKGLTAGEHPERWNITHPDVITSIHKAYFDAGSNVVNTNTFGANILKFSEDELEKIVKSAIENARTAQFQSVGAHEKYVALDIGPTGKLLKPLGELDFEDAVEIFAKTVRLGVKYGADLITVETMNDSYETKAALLAVKENSGLPVIVSNAYSEDGKLMTGALPAVMTAILEGMGADVIGINCSFGPQKLAPIAEEYLKYASVPVLLKANAGIPRSIDGKTVFDIDADEFAEQTAALIKNGVRVAGGCCGTTPEYISALCARLEGEKPRDIAPKTFTAVTSYSKTVFFDRDPVLIGERINPTGKKRFKQALRENDMNYILSEGLKQQECGVHVLDVNVGLPEVDEPSMLTSAVCELQAVCELPLQIDTSDITAMERALRRYNGKAMINSVNGKRESMEAVFPLMKKYGGVAVALTLDENGIPETAEGRVAIAERIIATAAEYGIDKKDLVFDTLAMAVSADKNAARVTLASLDEIKHRLGVHTSLGVSNISFGLPERAAVNSTFFASALERGLSAAIINPFSADMMRTYYSFRALNGLDENCAEYIAAVPSLAVETKSVAEIKGTAEAVRPESELQNAVIKGLREQAGALTEKLLETQNALDIVNNEIIPALDIVGADYESGRAFLPQLLMSAEAAKKAFEQIKRSLSGNNSATKGVFVIATVKGDIHDIGKNIVKLLLENYGFEVVDLGKDVPPEKIVETAKERNAPVVGLSALMTTTVPAMEETIKQLRAAVPQCKIVVGGAVMTAEYANSIGADKYAKDAMETVRYAEEIATKLKG